MAKKGMWTTAKEYRLSVLASKRKELILQLAREGFSYGDIEEVIRVNKGTAYRIVKSV